MRVALMAMTDEGGAPVRLGGRPIAWHQMQAALALGCERVVCLAAAPGPALAALQREAEEREVKFSAIAQPRALSGLVNAADTLFVFAPGVLPEREWLAQALGARAGIASLPADRAVELGFERIDRERAWAGVLSTRGDAVEMLTALPPDADPIAGLLRIALQRGGRCVDVPQKWLDDGRWALLGDVSAAHRVEAAWQARHVPSPQADRPGEVLAHRLARALLPQAAMRPQLAPALAFGGMALSVGGGIAGYLGNTLPALVAVTVAALISGTGERLGRFDRAGAGVPPSRRLAEIRDAIVDLSLVAIAASPQEFAGWPVPFTALVLVAAIRLAREDDAPAPMRPFGDRVLVTALLTLATAAGGFALSMAAASLIALALRLFWPGRRG